MRTIVFISLCFVLTGCTKDDFTWDLPRVERIPTVETIGVENITNTGALIPCEVLFDGGSEVTQRGICWSLESNPTTANNVQVNGSGIGLYEGVLSGLNPNRLYYARAFATNKIGTAYGDVLSFTTTNFSGSLPTVSTTTASSISQSSAVSGGNVTNNGGVSISQRGVCWSTTPNPTLANNSTSNGSGSGSFVSSLNGLLASTTYYVRAYATNGIGTSYGNQISFTTSSASATLVGSEPCGSLNGVTSLYYGMNGTSAPWGISSNGYSGSCWAAPDPNNSGQLGTVVGSNHYVSFNRNFTDNGYIEFWVNTYNPGYNNLIPVISVNNVSIGNATVIGGGTSSFDWMKVRSPQISAGNNTIKITLNGSYYIMKVDEISYFEY